jgi:alpha/beta superfamily hydrolase
LQKRVNQNQPTQVDLLRSMDRLQHAQQELKTELQTVQQSMHAYRRERQGVQLQEVHNVSTSVNQPDPEQEIQENSNVAELEVFENPLHITRQLSSDPQTSRSVNVNASTQHLDSAKSSTVRINTEGVGQSRYHHAPFTLTAQEWLKDFKKVVKYYKYSAATQAAEFMMAMQGSTSNWWDTLTEAEQGDINAIEIKFTHFFGGSNDTMSKAINDLYTLKQGNESMATFELGLLLAINF